MFTVTKRHKRMWIDQDGSPSYTPPNFIRLQSRDPLHKLAAELNQLQSRDIGAIAEFEARHSPR